MPGVGGVCPGGGGMLKLRFDWYIRAVKADQTTDPYSNCDPTKAQYRVLSVATSLKSLQFLFIKPGTLFALLLLLWFMRELGLPVDTQYFVWRLHLCNINKRSFMSQLFATLATITLFCHHFSSDHRLEPFLGKRLDAETSHRCDPTK